MITSISLYYFIVVQCFVYLPHPDGGIAFPAAWLLAKNTHRVFFSRSPLPSGHTHCLKV
jgi:hypothetical protein